MRNSTRGDYYRPHLASQVAVFVVAVRCLTNDTVDGGAETESKIMC